MSIESLSTNGSPTAEDLLQELGSRGASGVLEINHPADEVSHVWLREGRIYAMHVPGYRPALGIRLLSGGLLTPEQLSAAAAQQRERFPTHLIGQVLVGMGLVAQEVIDAFVMEQVLDQLADLLDLPIEDAQFHAGRRIQQDVIAPTDFAELHTVACQRRAHRADVLAAVGGPHAVPTLGSPGRGSGQTPLGPYDWALLCRVDGRRDVTELARVCGFTVQESAQIVADLALTGLLVLPEPAEAPEEPLAPVVALRPEVAAEPVEPEWHFDGTAAGEPEPVHGLLAEFSAFVHDEAEPEGWLAAPLADEATVPAHEPSVESALEPAPGLPDDAAGAPAVLTDTEADTSATPAPAAGYAFELPLTAPDPARAPEHLSGPERADVAQPFQTPEHALVAATAVTAAEPTFAPPASGPAAGARFPDGAPVAPPTDAGFSDTSVFMRELSSLSDDPESEAPVVTRLVVPLTEQHKTKKRRFFGF